MFTLRLFFTGLLLIGPTLDSGFSPTEMWILAPEETDHNSWLKLGCDAQGENCAVRREIKGLDLKIFAKGKEVAMKDRFSIDGTHANLVAKISDLNTQGQERPLAELLQSPIPDPFFNRLHFRVHLNAGDQTDYHARGGRISARDYDLCRRFKNGAYPERPVAETVVYEIEIWDNEAEVHFSRLDGKTPPNPQVLDPQGQRVYEAWIVHEPTASSDVLTHYKYLAKLTDAECPDDPAKCRVFEMKTEPVADCPYSPTTSSYCPPTQYH